MLPVMRNTWMPEVFNDFFDTDFMPRTNATAPAINVKETEHDYTVELAAAGMKKDDFNINIDADGNLHIKMEKKNEKKEEEKKEHYLRREFSYSNYQQVYVLPDDVVKDNIGAKVDNGVLTITMPRVSKDDVKRIQRQIAID
ncbi:MAG: Hsp20/alpha crystallin family protein [Prevotellaceae bacterium]|nr:Hsp20/alpha crystallin family protein [Prevotellaceae bacterium]